LCCVVLCCVVLSFIHSQIERDKESVIYTHKHIYISYSVRRTHFSFSLFQWVCENRRDSERVIVCVWDLLCVWKRERIRNRDIYIKQNVCLSVGMWRDNTHSLFVVFFLSLSLCTSSTIFHHNHRLRSIQWNSKHLNNIWMWR
jgi:hypothetical protein